MPIATPVQTITDQVMKTISSGQQLRLGNNNAVDKPQHNHQRLHEEAKPDGQHGNQRNPRGCTWARSA